ncbi:C40 family peptidase [Streptomyces sp. P38-E01]|uniref:C40 family peptidase n=1 Tax=Streptomyces tardus TaxID=2780544 RepID=A0A949JE09_9ACTN|nr:C40 family peptidase [Streptomyces tardus]MBU7598322.1 C40 family peptidase [Streptomyces tardus]
MSSNAHIRRHRKPRVSSRNSLLTAGVAGGVFTTLAVTGASAPVAAESGDHADTAELPTLGSQVSTGTNQAVYATQSIAVQYELDAAKADAQQAAQKTAAKAKKAEEAKKEAARKAAAEAAAERETELRAARSAERTAPDGQGGGSSEAAPSTPASGTAAAVANFARAQVGKAYVMGSTGPNAYDCSGLTTAALKQAGVSLPRTSQAQSSAGTEVGLGNLQPGDVLYWGGKGSATHVAIYVGDGQYVGAQNPSSGVAMHPLNWGGTPSGAVRFL